MSNNLNLATLNEVVRRMRHIPTITATGDTAAVIAAAASDPLLRSTDSTTAILTAGNDQFTVAGIACDGHGSPLPSARIQITVSGTGLTNMDSPSVTTGTLVLGFNGMNDAGVAVTGGTIIVTASATGAFSVTITGANTTTYNVAIRHLYACASGSVLTT
jgi:hypothetical protein